ncbi:MAG: hypothetical protein ATN31_10785 [Candidatus Epulonipiscioides saccharophilum]|nr:MAG: hypothetical protein ATN31_10785 [Epulopiscium sp. AS2M-Bin001]
MVKKVELLAPVGKLENAYAAIENGADAIFLGAQNFNARVNAQNFDPEQMNLILEYAKLRNVKSYITVNTIIKDDELPQMHKLLENLQNLNVDAIIIQDLGILNLAKKYFPDLKLHASTQLSAHSYEDVLFLKNQGFSRVVLARELSLDEIIRIKNEVDIELETFVHGALCYSYSGQCSFSNVIGHRSGNRGSCAQPCRMTYSLYKSFEKYDECISDNSYLLSLKDLCSLKILPDLVNAKIDSFKIEGRMKSPEYVASVVSTYRKYLDNLSASINNVDLDNLKSIFNRGNFSTGYYNQEPNINMITQVTPKNIGLKIGKIMKFDKKSKLATIYTQYDLNKGDGIEVWNNSRHVGVGINKVYNQNTEFNIKLDYAQVGADVYMTKNHNLVKSLKKTYEKLQRKRKINAHFYGKVGQKIQLKFICQNIEITVIGDPLDIAINAPTSKDQIEEKIKKLGNTPFEIDYLDINFDDNAFLSISALNDLKRKAVEKLMEVIMFSPTKIVEEYKPITIHKNSDKISIQVYSKDQLKVALDFPKVDVIYYPFDYKFEKSVEAIKLAKSLNKKMVITLPYIMHSDLFDKYKGDILELAVQYNVTFLCRTLGQVNLCSRLNLNFEVDYNLNVSNAEHAQFYTSLGAKQITASNEFYDNQDPTLQKVVYGHYPIMTTKQCLLNHYGHCKKNQYKKNEQFYIKDRKNINWNIKTDCDACTMQIFTPKHLSNLDYKGNIRLDFTFESAEKMRKIIRKFIL